MSTPRVTTATTRTTALRRHALTGALAVGVLGIAAGVEAVTGWSPYLIAPLAVAAVMLGVLQ
ncbi:hypothetical protein [Kineosporia sp. A_224]|uniref:hypothetical protein n=1 Tax=Kineosporia sp. A_224 TaxID=1962180 RepID=UPI000B4B349A|nr:hypothetical protein [Kineosporia sp. A_224]